MPIKAASTDGIEQGGLLTNFYQNLFIKLLHNFKGQQVVLHVQDGPTFRIGEDSDEPVRIEVMDKGFFKRALLGGSIGFGESYVDGDWKTDNLTAVIRHFARNLPALDRLESRFSFVSIPANKLGHWLRRNSVKQAKKNILAHYDLGNALYRHFLDDSMCYSSAIYPQSSTTLADAQQHKMRRILQQLELQPGQHLLEIGTGWGALAIMAARDFDCQVTTTTLSEEQYALARQRIDEAGLGDKITLLRQDYRQLTGSYDKIVSVEMIEAVGEAYLAEFFAQCQTLLKPGGKMAMQSITIADQRLKHYAKGVDFIQKHIFPGGFLPSVSLLSQHIAEQTQMTVRNLFDFGQDYARTLQDWRDELLTNKHALHELGYDERFMRLWLFYFAYCEAGFLEKTISVVQLTLEKRR